ncbi:tRNA pseudouridine(38/39) synthase [Hemibagrus wyckioides]|uniref:tRNA pseudouridine(38/39) synthase n=1 Tax=Hemibagrus wyckioides TaxID=337641 RepID=UPI00266D104D|nr:tRNA pseudouridine(38/39) synthase [Hemibagrus wyckioides]XP_058251593.1 tRNA pseudouridine(38/39) synthase [Hemibagrus wyckioides]XP_058251600.1 tRNA pseudouridine(38/39) synthase [Hemibagrus wyckioides]XP_058251608.1 tRNA pseudouridine(38/39) synthase [Hemibagrus wyckioides]XP_058251616.1 tRNA pseudouridine(38/39) synthase [Hemibagrus wyckioides]
MSASKEALQARVKALEEEVERLKYQLRGKSDQGTMPPLKAQENSGNSKRGKKAFDFAAHPRRHVALRLAYLGWQYQGFAVQENTDNTVEARVFEALLKTKLVQDRQSSNYHRCGRTDKGVSAFSQVISIDLRSSQFSGLGVTVPDGIEPKAGGGAETKAELPYVKMLNRVLPPDIRALGWSPVPIGFSARFDCQSRTYRYYFPCGDLDVQLMAEAAKRYEGTHDFRNLCKMDVGNGVLQFQRTITSASVQPCQPGHPSPSDPQRLYVFEVKGLAFLYHQVRCMMAVLLLIGQKLEAPDVINQLLDVKNNPRKPQYSMAVDYPLVLYECHFDGLRWISEPEEESHVLSSLLQHWTQTAVRAQVLNGMIHGLQSPDTDKAPVIPCCLMEGSRQRNYRPLLERPRCESLESRIQHFVKRGRLEREEGEGGEEGSTVFRGKRSKHSHQASSKNQEDADLLSQTDITLQPS